MTRLQYPMTTWQGKCGHLWDRAINDTDRCPYCSHEAKTLPEPKHRAPVRVRLDDIPLHPS